MSLSLPAKWLTILLVMEILGVRTPEVMGAELTPKTVETYDKYVQLTGARINGEVSQTAKFLYVDGLSPDRHSQVLAALKRGEIFMERLQTLDTSGHKIEAPEAIIHHWLGALFAPGANLHETIALMQDYNRHQDIYKPEVVRSRLLSHQGNDFTIYYRLRKKKVITITLNTNHDVHYFQVNSTRWYSRSYSTRIAEVANADTPNEREKPIGHDGGFLWRINSYWKFEEKDGGVYIECESISLTRDIPTGLGWLIKPFVTSIPKESLAMTMGSTQAALAAGSRQ
jgi:hypothetical protein